MLEPGSIETTKTLRDCSNPEFVRASIEVPATTIDNSQYWTIALVALTPEKLLRVREQDWGARSQ